MARPLAVDLMLDSGAYTAWKKGTPVVLKEYIAYAVKHQELIGTVVNLDVIPGVPGGRPSSREVVLAAEASFKNYQEIKRAGLKVMPVYHNGEPRSFLSKYLDLGCDYIGIGGLAATPIRDRVKFLDQVFAFLCGHRGYPETRIHGFGITDRFATFRYPWWSVDSSSWVRMGAYGIMYIPPRGDSGRPDFTRPAWKVILTDHTIGEQYRSMQIESHGRNAVKYVSAYFEEMGYAFDELRMNHTLRKQANAHYWHRIAQELPPPKFHALQTFGLFHKGGEHRKGRRLPLNSRVTVFLVASPFDNQMRMLTNIGHRQRLLSYIYLRGSSVDLPGIVRNGIATKKRKPIPRVRLSEEE